MALQCVLYRMLTICEIKETLLKIQQDLQEAIKAEGNASVVLKKAISNSNSIVNGICNAIVKAEQNTEFYIFRSIPVHFPAAY